jgi:hypothetical protein
MRVIKRGDECVADWKDNILCGHCASQLEIEANDLSYHPATGGNPHDWCEEYFTVQCGACSRLISTHVPENVRRYARSRSK